MTVVTVSNWLKGETEQSFLKKYDVKRVYNGIDNTVFRPVESDIKDTLGIKDKFILSERAKSRIESRNEA